MEEEGGKLVVTNRMFFLTKTLCFRVYWLVYVFTKIINWNNLLRVSIRLIALR